VNALASLQVAVDDRFAELLDAASAPFDKAGEKALSDRPTAEKPMGGLLLGGGFGVGKSHVLEALAHRALDAGFVVSKVVISKETALHDPASVFRAAIDSARVPGRPGSAIDEIAAGVSTHSEEAASLRRWVHSDDNPVDRKFAATLFLFEHARGDAEFVDRILRFWAGHALPVPELRRRLKEAGAGGTYKLSAGKESGLAVQRFRFISRLIRAAGHRGWVILLDEVELIGRYSLLQRAKSYAEVARWVRGDREDPTSPLAAVLVGKNDIELVGKRLRAKGTAEGDRQATLAELGMRVIEREQLRLQAPDRAALDRTYTRLKALHGTAYGWEPPDVEGLERLPSNRMRQYVRAWINEWDLGRLDPLYQPDTTATVPQADFSEEVELERGADPAEADPDDPASTDVGEA